MSFSSLGLSEPIVNAVTESGYSVPTPIQSAIIPAVLAGKNLIAGAETGTGKTAGFVLPLLELLEKSHEETAVRGKRVRVLILAPTRELAIQVHDSIERYGQNLSLSSMVMIGGVDVEPQKQRLIQGVDFLVATPGRLLDMLYQRAVHLDELQALVVDEADRMLEMGFIGEVRKVIERLPDACQRLMFSATLTNNVRKLADLAMDAAVEIDTTVTDANTPRIDQWLVTVDKDTKSALLSHLIKEHQWAQALIFIQTKHGAAKLVTQLEKRGIPAEAFHSGRSQAVRTQLMTDFKSGKLQFLVATGVVARGIDIDGLTRVVNYDLPDDADDYIHRIGRTGRAGAVGEAISFVSLNDFRRLCAIESRLGHLIVRKDIDGFAPRKVVPISILNYQPKNPRGPKNSANGRKQTGRKSNSARKNTTDRKENDSGRPLDNDNGPRPASKRKPFNPWEKSKRNR